MDQYSVLTFVIRPCNPCQASLNRVPHIFNRYDTEQGHQEGRSNSIETEFGVLGDQEARHLKQVVGGIRSEPKFSDSLVFIVTLKLTNINQAIKNLIIAEFTEILVGYSPYCLRVKFCPENPL